ncbi:MAG TPA: hypothetical protein VF175_14230 [Lacipirellula sp.]
MSSKIVLPAAIVAALLMTPVSGEAATVAMSGSDAFGASSFNAGTNWTGGGAPSAGNDYVTNDFRMRTPADGNSYTFGGDSLTVNNTNGLNGGLMYKGAGNTGVLTINNLILDGGRIHHQNGVGDLFQLAGAINVVSDSSIHAKQGNIEISAPISGAGNLLIPATDAPAENNRYVTLLGDNSYTGSIDVAGRFRLGDAGSLVFDIGAAGVNNSIAGTGTAEFNGAFNFALSGASTTIGDSWNIASVANQTFGDTFTVTGFNSVQGGAAWSDGTYLFDEATGVLSVIPEPTSGLMAVGGIVFAFGASRVRRG